MSVNKEQKKIKLGITLTNETFKVLDEEAKTLGLTKSQYIALLINQNFKK